MNCQFKEITYVCRIFYKILGLGFLHLKWNWIKITVITALLLLCLLNNIILVKKAYKETNLNLFSCCFFTSQLLIMMMSKNCLMIIHRDKFQKSFNWIEKCVDSKKFKGEIAEIWKNILEPYIYFVVTLAK